MNNVNLIGRLVKDPEIRYSTNNIALCKFTIAVDRRIKKEGQQNADFINCVAWRQTAEFISKYFLKGSKIVIEGSIQSRSWDDADGNRLFATDVLVDHVEFAESRKSQGQENVSSAPDSSTVTTTTSEPEMAENSFYSDDETVPF